VVKADHTEIALPDPMSENVTIQAAVFDLGGVVIDVSVEAVMDYWARASGASPEELAAAAPGDTRHHLLELGEITIHDYHEHVVAMIGRPLSFEDFLAGWNSIFAGLVDGIEPLLAELAGRLRLVAFSNTNAAHADVFLPLYADALAHFERIFLSHEMGVRKPDPASFSPVLEHLSLPPGSVAFIDDRPGNVAAAEALGMRGIVADGAAAIARGLRQMGVPVGD